MKIIGVDLKTISDQAQGDSRITATASQAISADLTIDMAGLSFQALEVLTGVTATSSNVGSSTEHDFMTWSNFRFPYWGLLAQAWSAEDNGDTLVWLPRVKIMSGFSWRLEFGKIVTPQYKATAILDDNFGAIMQLIFRKTITALTIPPAQT